MSQPNFAWKCGTKVISIGHKPLIMGIVNVTPDSFSDGGRFFETETAVRHAEQLIADGADILDIGGESTRPGAEVVSAAEEGARVIPVIRELKRRTGIPLSVDTSKAEVAEWALEVGADIINDVTGLSGDPRMLEVAAKSKAGVVVMHMQGTPRTMQIDPQYGDVVKEVDQYFEERLAKLTEAGIAREAISLDPGIGFGKRQTHNLELLRRLDRFSHWKLPICLGVSRKGFIHKALNRPGHAEEGDYGTVGVLLHAVAKRQVQIARVHNVRALHDAMTLFLAIENNG